jgi:CHAT domain-containing protein
LTLLSVAACRAPAGKIYAEIQRKTRFGELDAALAQADRAYREWSSRDVEWAWRFRVEKAHILVLKGGASAAIQLLSENVPSFLATSDVAARRSLVLGLAHDFSQQFDQAERDLATAEQLAQTFQLSCAGDVAQARGILEFDQKRYHEADSAFHNALSIARRENLPFLEVNAMGSLGNVAMVEEHYDEAIDRFTAALRLSEQLGLQLSRARAFGALGWSSKELGDFENALTYYKRAEEASARSGLVGDRLYWLTGISNVYYLQRDYHAAESVLTQALDLARKQDDRTIPTEYLNDLAEIALETGHTGLAESRYEEASRIIEQAGRDRSGVLPTLLIHGRISESKRDYAEAAASFRRVIGDPKAESAQRWEAQARLGRVYADEGKYEKAEGEFRHSLATIESVRSSVQAEDLRLSFLSSAISFYDEYIEFLISRHRAEDALQVAELSRARTLAEGLGAAPKTLSFPLRNFQLRQIAQRTKSVLLFYWLGQKQSHLWVITPAKVTCLASAGAVEIDPLVKSYREAVLSGRDVLAGGSAEGEKLYTLLIEPAKKFIPAGSRVILLPDGSMYGLNFETLLVPAPKPHFWIEDVTLTTASSLTLLSAGRDARGNSIRNSADLRAARCGRQPFGTQGKQDAGATPGSERRDATRTFRYGNLLLVGDAAQAAAEFPVLRQAQAEMAQVGRYFPEARRAILSGAHATPNAFLSSEPEKFAYLHFVTHGSASRAHPLDSAVILSPEGDSFKLYARDIVKHPLSAYLVTVSACNGSGTRAYSGEGLVGLSWAFLRAGAHNVIAALWEVNDASTPQLMDKLYAELSEGRDPATALRAAKLSLLHSDSVFSKPFYWAPFQLYAGS